MVDVTPGHTGWDAWSQPLADAARQRFHDRELRLKREKLENDARLAAKAAAKLQSLQEEKTESPEEIAARERKKAIIAAAIERARLKKLESDNKADSKADEKK
jgi:electron transport complex protein RnfB